MIYFDFLKSKYDGFKGIGFKPEKLNNHLFPFQVDIVNWACKKGRAAIWADCGMGKTIMQLEWAHQIAIREKCKTLIIAPLAVASQTVREGKKFNIDVEFSRDGKAHGDITVCNYDMLDKFSAMDYQAVVVDESSILKSMDGKTRTAIIEMFSKTPYRLACTATPAPNDYVELGNHAQFLGIMSSHEMLAKYFYHDGGETQKWTLKGHAENDFWKWICSWAVIIRKPSDIGHPDGKFLLPKLNMFQHKVIASDDGNASDVLRLFPMQANTLEEQRHARKITKTDRVSKCAEIVNKSKEEWIIWGELNDECDMLEKAIPGAVQVSGADSIEEKEKKLLDFITGKFKKLIIKPKIGGFGLNLQHCHNVAFVGVTHSFEQYYQAIRRCWRFGQPKEVNCHLISSDIEGPVLQNLMRKELDSTKMIDNMIKHVSIFQNIHKTERVTDMYKTDYQKGKKWEMHLGDCVETIKQLTESSIDYSIFSPPFASLYTYSNSMRDMGNCKTHGEFYEHFKFLVVELLRVIKPGRLLSFHCMNLPTSKTRDGYIGISDFRGLLIKLFQDTGWIYHSEVVIWKDPVTAMQRTKALGLLHKQLKKDSCMSRQGIPDYLVTMRKPGENPNRVAHTNESFPVDLWQRYASPVWFDIKPGRTLQKESAREDKDEKHICPLQLDVIERALELWTNDNDLVLSPFAGIGSEGYCAVNMGRRFIGMELKESYYKQAVLNLSKACGYERKLI